MIAIKRSEDRGHLDHGWLDTYHSFSFGEYYDPRNMGYRSLRVINEDVVAPGQGFGTHPHRDMEIITYVLEGALEHRDSMGSHGVIRPGEIQRMSAGTGVRHSEFNHSKTEPVHLLQIWIMPDTEGVKPSYEEKKIATEPGKLQLMAAKGASNGTASIHQDAKVYVAKLAPGQSVEHDLASGRGVYVHVARGAANVNGNPLKHGDAIAVEQEPNVRIANEGAEQAEILLFDLA
jgi:redox-sensitive bicupin YhaK (pirin superfamily)